PCSGDVDIIATVGASRINGDLGLGGGICGGHGAGGAEPDESQYQRGGCEPSGKRVACTEANFVHHAGALDRKSTRMNSSHAPVSPLSLHDALPICPVPETLTSSPPWALVGSTVISGLAVVFVAATAPEVPNPMRVNTSVAAVNPAASGWRALRRILSTMPEPFLR